MQASTGLLINDTIKKICLSLCSIKEDQITLMDNTQKRTFWELEIQKMSLLFGSLSYKKIHKRQNDRKGRHNLAHL